MVASQSINSPIKTIYNPGLLDKETLIENFIVRKNVFKSIFERDIAISNMKRPDNHILITGQRGMGKTTLLLRLKYAVEDHEELSKWLVPIMFKENEYYIDSLFNLWIVVLEYLASATTNTKDRAEFEELLEDINYNYDHPRYKDNKVAYEKFIFEKLIQSLQEKEKKLILLIDNFHEILETLDRTETQVLRERLSTCADIRIIAASSKYIEALEEYSGTFYENFKKEKLEKLNKDEIKVLYKNLAKQHNMYTDLPAIQKNTFIKEYYEDDIAIKTFGRLTDGVIRTLVILFDVINNEDIGEILTKLEQVLDELTPYFEQKINRLKPQSRKIFHAIALNYDGISVKEINKTTRIPSKAISSSLVLLVKNELIEKKVTNTKNHLYFIKERFLNVWYLMRYGRKDGVKNIEYSVLFLKEWLPRKRLERLLEDYKVNDYNSDKQKLIETLSQLLKTQNKDNLENKNFPFSKQDAEEFTRLLYLSNISPSTKEKILTDFPYLTFDKYKKLLDTLKEERNFLKGKRLQINGKRLRTHKDVQNYSLINPDFEYNQEEFQNLLFLSSISLETKRKIINKFHSLSPESYQKILYELESESTYLKKTAKEQIVKDSEDLALATLYEDYLLLPHQSLALYKKSAEEGNLSYYNLGKIYMKNKYIKKAEKYFKIAVNENDYKAAHELGVIYKNHYKVLKKASRYFKLSYNNTNNEDSLYNYALTVHELKDFETARDTYKELLELPKWQKGVIYNSLANVYNALDKDKYFEEAKENYEKAIYYEKTIASGQEQYAERNLAGLYIKHKKYEEGEKKYLKLIQEGDKEAANSLAWRYYIGNYAPKKALKYAKLAYKERPDSLHFSHTYATVLLWNNKTKEILEPCKVFLSQLDKYPKFSEDVMDFLILLIAKKGYSIAFDLFTNKEYKLKDRYRPIYYALMREEKMKKKYPNEHLKMGSELEETVKEVQDEIIKKREKYA